MKIFFKQKIILSIILILVLVFIYFSFESYKYERSTKIYENYQIVTYPDLIDVQEYKQYVREDDFVSIEEYEENEQLEIDDTDITLRSHGNFIFIRGTVNSKSYNKFANFLKENPNKKVIVFTSVQGSIDDDINIEIAKQLHDIGFITYLPSDGETSSGGVELFLAGQKRYIEKGGKVGVHSWADGSFLFKGEKGSDVAKDSDRHDVYLNYYDYVEAPRSHYWFTLTIPAEDIYFMNFEELTKYKVYTNYI